MKKFALAAAIFICGFYVGKIFSFVTREYFISTTHHIFGGEARCTVCGLTPEQIIAGDAVDIWPNGILTEVTPSRDLKSPFPSGGTDK